jgi:hypothetical protein
MKEGRENASFGDRMNLWGVGVFEDMLTMSGTDNVSR